MALMRSEQVGPSAHTSTVALGVGRIESYVATGLQRLGLQVIWCGRVRADPPGQRVER
jgi:2-dehydro-3-deoxygluconokinase